MKLGLWTLLLFALISVPAQAASNENVALVSSRDAKGMISAEHMNTCLRQLLREWKLSDKESPHIVVMRVSKAAARTVLVKGDYAVRKNWSSDHLNFYYEVWRARETRPAAPERRATFWAATPLTDNPLSRYSQLS